MQAAFLRPMGLLVVVIGAFFFATTLAWWILPLTLATYVALVFLAARDPIFRSRVLEGRERQPGMQPGLSTDQVVSPERRARWLPRGETRRKVEEALEVHRRTVLAIEELGGVAQAVLSDAVPKLHYVAERLVDVAEKREKAAGAIRDLKTRHAPPPARITTKAKSPTSQSWRKNCALRTQRSPIHSRSSRLSGHGLCASP
jgi:hypothetical protein